VSSRCNPPQADESGCSSFDFHNPARVVPSVAEGPAFLLDLDLDLSTTPWPTKVEFPR
jgi:hypothetical protein